MKFTKYLLIAALSLGMFTSPALSLPTEHPAKYFNDYAHVVTPQVADKLNEQLAQVERDTSNQVVVVVDNKLDDGASLENDTIDHFRSWGVGQKGKDNGVLFVVHVDSHKMRIEVGRGLEGSLTDSESTGITNGLKPYFRNKNYDGGFEYAVNEIVKNVGLEGNKGAGRTVVEQKHDQQVAAQKTSFQHEDYQQPHQSGYGFVLFIILLVIAGAIYLLVKLVRSLFPSPTVELAETEKNEEESTSTPQETSDGLNYSSDRSKYYPPVKQRSHHYPRVTVPTTPYVAPTPAPQQNSTYSNIGTFAAGAAAGVAGDELVRAATRRRRDDSDDSPSSYSSSSSSSSDSSPSYSSSSSSDSSSSYSSSDSSSSYSSSDFGGGGGDSGGGGSSSDW